MIEQLLLFVIIVLLIYYIDPKFVLLLAIPFIGNNNKISGWAPKEKYVNEPFGNRCYDDGSEISKENCEIKAISNFEKIFNFDNIKNNIYDRGFKFIMNENELSRILKSREYKDFIGNGLYNLPIKILGSSNSTVGNLSSKNNLLGYYKRFANEYAFNILQGEISRKNNIQFKVSRIDINIVIENNFQITKNSFERIFKNNPDINIHLVRLGLKIGDSDGHANTLVILKKTDNNKGLVFLFESNITYASEHKGVFEYLKSYLVEKLPESDYIYDNTYQLPYGLQALTNRGDCATWSIFISILLILNKDKNPKETLLYLVAMQEEALELLFLFAYYIYEKYYQEIENTVPSEILNNIHLSVISRIRRYIEHISSSNKQNILIQQIRYYFAKNLNLIEQSITEHNRYIRLSLVMDNICSDIKPITDKIISLIKSDTTDLDSIESIQIIIDDINTIMLYGYYDKLTNIMGRYQINQILYQTMKIILINLILLLAKKYGNNEKIEEVLLNINSKIELYMKNNLRGDMELPFRTIYVILRYYSDYDLLNDVHFEKLKKTFKIDQ